MHPNAKAKFENAHTLSAEQLALLKEIMPEEFAEWMNSRPLHKYLNEFVTVDPALLKMKEQVKLLSDIDDPVMIFGETGTGKELIARALHGDRKGPFIDINCAGIPDALIESELFGHVKGAFTSASRDKTGLLQAAYQGTVFLDEIGELARPLQAKILRAIQEKCIRKVGSEEAEPIPLHCRFVSATHRKLSEEILTGNFREDLFWRLNVFTLKIPSLRERPHDIEPILRHIITKDRGVVKHDVEDIKELAIKISRKKEILTGNVRQLQQMIRNFHVLGEIPGL